MAKEAVFQLRMDAETKEQVELLYQRLGTSFAEAVRMFAAQSLHEQGMPFKPSVLGSKLPAKGGAEAAEESGEDEQVLDQPLMDAIALAMEEGHVSLSMLQQHMQISYASAGRLISRMEALGVVSGMRAGKPREVLMSGEQYEALKRRLNP